MEVRGKEEEEKEEEEEEEAVFMRQLVLVILKQVDSLKLQERISQNEEF